MASCCGRWVGPSQLFYLDGKIEGDISCPQDEVDAGDDPVGNPFGCEEASNDTMSITSWGLELGYAWQATPTVDLFVTGLWQQLDSEFQVRALYDGFLDRNRLVYDGDDYAWTAGAGWQATEKLRLAGELFYSPLDVVKILDTNKYSIETEEATALASLAAELCIVLWHRQRLPVASNPRISPKSRGLAMPRCIPLGQLLVGHSFGEFIRSPF